MQLRKNLVLFVLFATTSLFAQRARAEDLNGVLTKLDAAARNFRSTSAQVEADTIQKDPIPNTDVMLGMAYYERTGNQFQMAAHFTEFNKQPTGKTYIFSGGVFRLSETGKEKDAKPYPQASKYESYLMLGFGASGHDLQEKWNITYQGTEIIDGVTTAKLELVAKDPEVRKNLQKVTAWMDTARAVSLKQIFDEGGGNSYQCLYTNIKMNQSLPKNAFAFSK